MSQLVGYGEATTFVGEGGGDQDYLAVSTYKEGSIYVSSLAMAYLNPQTPAEIAQVNGDHPLHPMFTQQGSGHDPDSGSVIPHACPR